MTAGPHDRLDEPIDADPAPVKGAKLRVRALGACLVTVGKSRIKPDSAVLFALTLYLAVRAGERLTRAEVLDLLWPGVESTARRHALRQLLYRLKRAGLAVDADGDELSLGDADVECDLTPFLRGSWSREVEMNGIPSIRSILPSYLPNVTQPFHDWVDDLRNRCGAHIRQAALRHIAMATREGRWADTDRMARLCLETDPLNEEATLALAEATAMSGSKAEAVRLLDSYLWEIGDREKSIAIPARILRRRISEQPVYRTPRAGEPPLIARADDIAWLNSRLADAATGRCATAMLLGPPGIGKSAVMRSFVSHSEMRGWRAIESRLQPSDIDRPMSVFVELFPPLLKASGALGAAPESIAQLRRLVEHDVVDDILANKSQEAEAVQARIRTSALDLLNAVTHEGPVVLVLEDLHWIDKQSLKLLTWMLEHASDAPVLWLLTARMESRFAELREVLPAERVPARTIASLGRNEAMTLFRASVPDDMRDREHPLPEQVYDVTGGNPLFIREVAGHWAETGASEGLPSNLKTIMRGRVARLSSSAQRVLHCCAVLGRFATVPRVTVVLEISTTDLLACIEEVDGLGLLGLGGEPGSLALHDLWQEELVSTLGHATLALLHTRCGEVLAAESADSKSASVVSDAARHLIAAGAKDRALRLLEEAAAHQLANGLSEDAVESCELALGIVTTAADRRRIVPVLIEALQHAGNWHRALQTCRDNTDVMSATSPNSPVQLAFLEALWRTGADVNACLEGAVKCAEDQTAPLTSRLRASLIAARCASNWWDAGVLARINAALAGMPTSAEADRSVELSAKIILESEIGSLDTAIALSNMLLARERNRSNVIALTQALRFAAYPRRGTGELGEALRLTAEAFELASQRQLAEQASQASDTCATILLEQGRLDECELWLERADSWATKISAQYGRRSLNLLRVQVHIRRGRLDDAEYLLSADAHLGPSSSPREHMAILEARCRLALARDTGAGLAVIVANMSRALEHSRARLLQDNYVSALVAGYAALGQTAQARSYAADFVNNSRRSRGTLSRELAAYLS